MRGLRDGFESSVGASRDGRGSETNDFAGVFQYDDMVGMSEKSRSFEGENNIEEVHHNRVTSDAEDLASSVVYIDDHGYDDRSGVDDPLLSVVGTGRELTNYSEVICGAIDCDCKSGSDCRVKF